MDHKLPIIDGPTHNFAGVSVGDQTQVNKATGN